MMRMMIAENNSIRPISKVIAKGLNRALARREREDLHAAVFPAFPQPPVSLKKHLPYPPVKGFAKIRID